MRPKGLTGVNGGNRGPLLSPLPPVKLAPNLAKEEERYHFSFLFPSPDIREQLLHLMEQLYDLAFRYHFSQLK